MLPPLCLLPLVWAPDTKEWSLAGHMMQARGFRAVSIIKFEDVYNNYLL